MGGFQKRNSSTFTLFLGLFRVEEENELSGTKRLPNCISIAQYQIFSVVVFFKTTSRKDVIAGI